MSDAAPSSKKQVVAHRYALRASVTDYGMVCRGGGGGVGRLEQSQAIAGAPGGICDTFRRERMPLVKAVSRMVRGAAIGSVPRKMEAERLAQLCSGACDLRPAATAAQKRSRMDRKAPAAA
jgi:hypothetical protein